MTEEEMQDTLDRLNIEVVSTRGDEFQALCPAHLERTGKVDNNPSWWINADTGAHICFSCGFKGGLQSLIAYVNGISFEDARSWMDSGERNLTAKLERITKPKHVFEEVTEVTESMLKVFTNPPMRALLDRGLGNIAASNYEVLWDERHFNWITLIRDPQTNKLLGWQEKGHTSRYFKNFPPGVKKSDTLFGYNRYNGGEMIIVESPFDVIRLATIGVSGGVSTYGASISIQQFNLIRGADRVIFALDNDDAGRAASSQMLSLAKDMGLECWFFNYSNTDMKDVGGMSKTEIEWGLANARHMIHGEKAIYGLRA